MKYFTFMPHFSFLELYLSVTISLNLLLQSRRRTSMNGQTFGGLRGRLKVAVGTRGADRPPLPRTTDTISKPPMFVSENCCCPQVLIKPLFE